MPENAVEIALLSARVQAILTAVERAEKSRGDTYRSIHNIERKLDHTNFRLDALETKFADASPTIAEFVQVKNRVQGAGMLGRWIWATGGFLIGLAAWASGIIQSMGK